MQNNHPELFVISAPSGAGKSTLIKKFLSSNNYFELSVSATTRPPRDGEVDRQICLSYFRRADLPSPLLSL